MLGDLLGSVLHPAEITAMFKLKFGGYMRKPREEPLEQLASSLSAVDFCYAVLHKVSRSFAVVIQQLPEQLRDPVCIFYLVLRGLDSVEDDMTIPLTTKKPLLLSFYQKLEEKGWHIKDVGDGPDYRVLLANFQKVIEVYAGLGRQYQNVITDITRRMGAGMAEFAEKTGCATVHDYNLYCHYVAGLVGHGLTRLFAASGLEDPNLDNAEGLRISNNMGLFLQKTNIIRDYLEDLNQGRTWWPDQVWQQYGNKLSWFRDNPTAPESVACLNHLICDALEMVPDCLAYLQRLADPQIFRFCAIPQVMAIATLAECFNNKDVFRKVCKIRKGLSAKMMLDTNDMNSVYYWFYTFANQMLARIPKKSTPSSSTMATLAERVTARTVQLLQAIRTQCAAHIPKTVLRGTSVVVWVLFLFSLFYLLYRFKQRNIETTFTGSSPMRPSADFTVGILFCLSLSYLFGFFGMNYI